MNIPVVRVLNILYFMFGIIALVLIAIDGCYPLELGGLARIGTTIIVLILFSLSINQYLAKKNRLDTEHYQLQNDCWNDQINPKDLFRRIFNYYNEGGYKSLYVEPREVIGLQWSACDSFRANLDHCIFYAGAEYNSLDIKINNFNFKGKLIGTKFINHTFEKVSFDAHCWGLTFEHCYFKNVDFSNTDTVTSSQFNVLLGQVENLQFYNTRVSSCNFISPNIPAFRDYKDSEAPEKYLNKFHNANRVHIDDWKGRFEFNSKTILSNVHMSFDIYIAIREEYKAIIGKVNIDPYSLKVTINPTNKSLPIYIP